MHQQIQSECYRNIQPILFIKLTTRIIDNVCQSYSKSGVAAGAFEHSHTIAPIQ